MVSLQQYKNQTSLFKLQTMRQFSGSGFKIVKPATCYYKQLNVSTQASNKDIKHAYYKLAKKYHPDAIIQTREEAPSEEEFNEIDKKFKGITEAYSILSSQQKRQQYDRLIFGEAADTPRDFGESQDAYDYWASDSQSQKKRQASHRSREDQQQEIRDKLRNYKDYSDFLKAYEQHKGQHEARSQLYREEGFSKLNEKFGEDYDHFSAQDDPNNAMNKDYQVYRERFYERYWDTHSNAEWYSQSLATRAWIVTKKIVKQKSLDPLYYSNGGNHWEHQYEHGDLPSHRKQEQPTEEPKDKK